MGARIDWTGLRKTSQTIPDFVDQLLKAVQKYPVDQRSAVLKETLHDISPEVEPKVARETKILVSRGYDAEKALKLAITVTLRSRRRRIFHWLFFTKFPELVSNFQKELKKQPNPRERQELLHKYIKAFTEQQLQEPSKEQAQIRLEETGFPQAVVEEALQAKWRSSEQILMDIQARIARGENEPEVIKDELRSMLLEFGLRFLMSQGVAKGPDFCSLALILGVVTTVVSVGVTVGTTVASSVAENKAMSKLDAAARAAEYDLQNASIVSGTLQDRTDLSEEELRRVAAASVEGGETYTQALRTLSDVLRNVKNRAEPTTTEKARFRALWGNYSTERQAGAIAQGLVERQTAQFQASQAQVRQEKMINYVVIAASLVAVTGGLYYVSKRK